MSDMSMFTSLADLANLDTSDIQVLRSRLQAEGIYVIRMTEAEMIESNDGTDGKPVRIMVRNVGDIMAFFPLDESKQEEALEMVGKRFSQGKTMFMNEFAEQIGLLKGMYQQAHLNVTGVMGGFGGIEGWLTDIVDKVVVIRVNHREVKDDTRVYYNWLGAKAVKALNIDWESEIGRVPVDKHNNPLDLAELQG